MTEIFTLQQVIAEVSGLNQARLTRFIEAEIVLPVRKDADREPPVFHSIDVARLQLACDLCDCYELQDEALAMVMGLVDQLHGLRGELRAVMRAIEQLPAERRREIGTVLQHARRD